jgi:hypothetical protein
VFRPSRKIPRIRRGQVDSSLCKRDVKMMLEAFDRCVWCDESTSTKPSTGRRYCTCPCVCAENYPPLDSSGGDPAAGAANAPRKVAMMSGDVGISHVRKHWFSSRVRLFGIAGGASVLIAVGLVSVASPASAVEATVGLGTAEAYSVLAGSTVTNTGPAPWAAISGLVQDPRSLAFRRASWSRAQ